MEGLRLAFLLCIFNPVFGEGVDTILGDPVKFSATENCKKSGSKLVHRLKDNSIRLVADRGNVWKPGPGYEDRMSPNDSVILNSSNINDNGLYELTCGTEDEPPIQLHVVIPSEASVTEGDAAKLPFHCVTVGETVRYIRCERNGELVSQLDLFSREVTYVTAFKDRVSLPPDWYLTGDLSPTLKRVKPEDQGDYMFYGLDKNGNRTGVNPAAVRMRVNKRTPEEKMGRGMIAFITVAVILIVVSLVAGTIWWLKFRRSNVSKSGPGGGRPSTDVTDVQMRLFTERGPAGSQANGGPSTQIVIEGVL